MLIRRRKRAGVSASSLPRTRRQKRRLLADTLQGIRRGTVRRYAFIVSDSGGDTTSSDNSDKRCHYDRRVLAY